MIRVGVIGAAGRMGSEVCRAVEGEDDLDLVARVDREGAREALLDNRTEVAVEFSTPASVRDNVVWCVEHGLHTVVGATGLGARDLADLERLSRHHATAVFVAPNFAIGAVLMMRFAAQAAPYFDGAEIVERHHNRKLDAPSGTALRTAELMNEARSRAWRTPAEGALAESRGGQIGGIRLHSLRVPGSVAHQEVILGSQGQTLTIRHDSLDRSSFMPGVMLAIKRVASLDGVVVGLENLLEI
jgi:4-hydroxy-tetrahydrodipicolinate reductase